MHRFPVLVWEDSTGLYTARLIDDEEDSHTPLAGVGRSVREALFQLKEYLNWSFEREPWRRAPDFHDPQLTEFRVEVRPEYQAHGRVYPGDEVLPLRVACVHGRQEGGLLVCALPLLGLQFYYYEAKALRGLVTTYVQEALKGQTPRQLSRHLPPNSYSLEEVAVSGGRRRATVVPDHYRLSALKIVADPLGADEMRRGFARAYERTDQVSELVRLVARERANVLLVGERGAGKTSILIDAVREVERELRASAKEGGEENADGRQAAAGAPHKFWVSGAARLIAGMKYLGQWEERCERVIEDLSRIDGVLAIEDLLDLVRTGGTSPNESVASFFLPFIVRGELRLIGEATPAGLEACRRLLPGFIDAFRILPVPPLTTTAALAALAAYGATVERNSPVRLGGGQRSLIYHLFQRFMPYEAFPGKTVKFTTRLYESARTAGLTEVGNEFVIAEFVKLTGLPELFLRDEVTLAEPDVRAFFEAEVIGQPEACRVAANLVLTFKAGLNDPARPLGVLLFTGPTGVGKTELARTLARFFFGGAETSERFVRLDMSEYSLPGSAERLIAGPGGEPSQFINHLRRQPFAVVLLDEIEKADEGVFDVLLSVFDEGRLTDRFGSLTYFRSALLIMTSNLGANSSDPPGFGAALDLASPTYHRAAQTFFRPEFYNRIDDVLSFQALDKNSVRRIVEKELAALKTREGLAKREIKLTWSDRLVEHLAQIGFSSRYGARPLQRTIEAQVITPLALYLNHHSAAPGAALHLDFDDAGVLKIS